MCVCVCVCVCVFGWAVSESAAALPPSTFANVNVNTAPITYCRTRAKSAIWYLDSFGVLGPVWSVFMLWKGKRERHLPLAVFGRADSCRYFFCVTTDIPTLPSLSFTHTQKNCIITQLRGNYLVIKNLQFGNFILFYMPVVLQLLLKRNEDMGAALFNILFNLKSL